MQIRLFETYLFEAVLSPEEIKEKYYKDLPQDSFDKIIKADPTTTTDSAGKIKKFGKYTKWLLQLYVGKKYKEDGKGKTFKLKLEDLYKATEYITLFNKFKTIIQREGDSANIFDYHTLTDLYKVIKKFEEADDEEEYMSNKSLEKKIKSEETEKVFENDNWLVLVPKTHRSACFYGKNTQWCTAGKYEGDFNHYNEQGPLYININKTDNTKYQFHFETASFMDEEDVPVSIMSIISGDKELVKFYEKIAKHERIKEENDSHYFYTEQNGWEYFAKYFSIPSDYRDNVVEMILSGDAFELFMYDTQDLSSYDTLDLHDESVKFLKDIIKNMAEDFEISESEIDLIKDFEDVCGIIEEYDLDDLKTSLEIVITNSQGYADESEAHSELTNEIISHLNFDISDISWEKFKKDDKYDSLKIKIKEGEVADTIFTFLEMENFDEYYGDEEEVLIRYSPPSYGYSAGHKEVAEYVDQEILERLPDDIEERYLPKYI